MTPTFDPLISELVALARAHQFRTIILCRHGWTEAQVQEFERATHYTGITVIGATVPSPLSTKPKKSEVVVNAMTALPEQLPPRTLYVMCSDINASPLFRFLHDKNYVGNWLAEAINAAADPDSRITYVPTFDQVMIPAEPLSPQWPNLVVKIAELDRGQFVAMGRFTTKDEARRALRVNPLSDGLPGHFRLARWQRVREKLFPGTLRTIYQPFIPPEVVDGRARLIRLHVFISPLQDTFLSAHGVIAGRELPFELAFGLVEDEDLPAYVVNYSREGRYCRLDPGTEQMLREVALDFGRLARSAINGKFRTEPRGEYQ